MEIYHDSHEDALRYIHKSDYSRKSYYEVISNKIWVINQTMIYV